MQSQIIRTSAHAATLAPWQQEALLDARAVAQMALGHAATVQVAEHHSGIYRGLIIGHTRDHVIQQIGKQAAAVIHAKDRFTAPNDNQFPWPEVGHTVSIQYSQSRAVAREVRERVRAQGRSR